MSESGIGFLCCDTHNDAYVEARRRSRAVGVDWTSQELKALRDIEEHLRELNGIANMS